MPETEVTWFEVIAYPVRIEIVGALSDSAEASVAELRDRSHASDPTLRQHLEALVAAGVVREREGSSDGLTPGRPAARFSLDPPVRAAASALLEVLAAPIGSWPRRTPKPLRDR